MADETPGRVAATLDEIRGRWAARRQYSLGFDPVDASRLLAAAEAALKLADEWEADSFIVDPEIPLRAAIATALTGTPGNDSEVATAAREDEGHGTGQ